MAEQMCMWVIPPIPGQVIILNPESSDYDAYMNHVGVESGVVTGIREQLIAEWHYMNESDKNDRKIFITFDNGKRMEVRLRNLIPISNLFKDVMKIKIRGGGELFDTVEKIDEKLDQIIIVEGRNLQTKKLYDHSARMSLLRPLTDPYKQLARSGSLSDIQLATYTEYVKIGAIQDEVTSTVEEPDEPVVADLGTPRVLIEDFFHEIQNQHAQQTESQRIADLLVTPRHPLTEGRTIQDVRGLTVDDLPDEEDWAEDSEIEDAYFDEDED